jgi:prepilin-type processing-associated H-X9-DG protein
VQSAREAARTSACNCNIKQFGLAFANYHDANGCYPPAYVTDRDGRPMHSWRVLILPYLEEAELYNRYNFDEPWDGPNNIKLLAEIPRIYKCPSHKPRPIRHGGVIAAISLFACSTGSSGGFAQDKCTDYAAALGPNCVFRGAVPVSNKDITDGTPNTVMIGEVTDVEIPWTKPEDIDVKLHPKIGDRMGFSSEHIKVVNFLAADGHVARLSTDMPQDAVDARFTRNGGEKIQDEF